LALQKGRPTTETTKENVHLLNAMVKYYSAKVVAQGLYSNKWTPEQNWYAPEILPKQIRKIGWGFLPQSRSKSADTLSAVPDCWRPRSKPY
jgi:hypothetical protein